MKSIRLDCGTANCLVLLMPSSYHDQHPQPLHIYPQLAGKGHKFSEFPSRNPTTTTHQPPTTTTRFISPVCCIYRRRDKSSLGRLRAAPRPGAGRSCVCLFVSPAADAWGKWVFTFWWGRKIKNAIRRRSSSRIIHITGMKCLFDYYSGSDAHARGCRMGR